LGSLAALFASVVLMSGSAVAASEADEVRLARASVLAGSGNCTEAIALVDEIGTDHAGAQQLRGQCHLEQARYADAISALESARALDAGLDGIELDLAMARYHLGDLAGARTALAASAAGSSDRAEYHLYNGLLLLQAADSANAARALDRARQIAPESVEPTASYYAGLAWAGADDDGKAAAAFDRVLELAPGSVWATEAERAQGRLAGGGGPSSWGYARLGVEWDDNVVLRGEGVRLPSEIGNGDDGRVVWSLHGGKELLRTRDWSGGATFTYYGSSHFKLDDFDEHYPVLGFWLDRRLGEATTFRLRYDFGYAWVDNDPFLLSHELTPAIFHDWGEIGRTKAFVTLYKYDYKFKTFDETDANAGGTTCSNSLFQCGPRGVNEAALRNRDGWGTVIGLEHLWHLGVLETELTTGVRWHDYETRGTEYDYSGPELWLGTETALPWELEFRTYVSWSDLDYDNASTYPRQLMPQVAVFTPSASDKESERWRARAELEWFFADRWSLMGRYSWSDNNSNVGVFDYSRWGVGIYVTYRFEGPLTP
jgi:tetratricopeptide (TPR) repeat protein